jgi:hypothetical protein
VFWYAEVLPVEVPSQIQELTDPMILVAVFPVVADEYKISVKQRHVLSEEWLCLVAKQMVCFGSPYDNGAKHVLAWRPFMSKKKVYIAFDYDDLDVKQNLIAESKRHNCSWEFIDHSIRQSVQGPWVDDAKRFIEASEFVIVLCGEQTYQAGGVAIELQIAQEMGKPYFFLSGTRKGTPTKPKHARAGDRIWTYKWPTVLKLLNNETPQDNAVVR